VLDRNVPQTWTARTTLVLTLTLVAIALGNLQRMPFLLGEHGGAVFFLLYLLALCLLSVPLLIAEVVVGSYGRASPHRAMEWAASAADVNPRWRFLGSAQGFLGAAGRSHCRVICRVVFRSCHGDPLRCDRVR
jgi:NSS family neurotransmitter:Na+ symporter